jgi:hypothetical protein
MKRNTPIHPKLIKLAAELKIRKYAAVGLLELLWHMTAQFAPEGDIGRFQDREISLQLDWGGDTTRLINALVNSRWLDKHPTKRLIVHDWSEHSDGSCDKYLSDYGRRYADGKPPRRKGDTPLQDSTPKTTSHDKSRQVVTSRDKSSLPKPIPKPIPKPKPLPVGAEPAAATMLDQVKRIKAIRKEFTALRDVDVENALKNCPPEFREAGITDFERDMLGALKIPDIPTKVLGSYMTVAARGGGSTAAGVRPWDDNGVTDTEKKAEEAYRALARLRK